MIARYGVFPCIYIGYILVSTFLWTNTSIGMGIGADIATSDIVMPLSILILVNFCLVMTKKLYSYLNS